MFEYEEYDFNSLLDDPAIDPDAPAALYALAQFCRTGKGCDPSESDYRFYLQRAADAGHEQAKAELEALTPAKEPQPEVDTDSMSLSELIRRADDLYPDSLLPAARRCRSMGDTERARRYLESAANLMQTGAHAYSDADGQEIYMTLAEMLEKDFHDTKGSVRAYGMAQEMGSTEAAEILAQMYRTGNGVEKDERQAEVYENIAAKHSSPTQKIAAADKLLKHDKAVDGIILLEQAIDETQNPDVAHFAEMFLAVNGQRPFTPELAAWCWEHVDENSDFNITLPIEEVNGSSSRYNIITFTTYNTQFYNNYPATPDEALAAGLPLDLHKAVMISRHRRTWQETYPWADYAVRTASPEEQQSADYAEALSSLASCFQGGFGVVKDQSKAVELFQQAADLGSSSAQRNLAKAYENGTGVPQDLAKAFALLTQAAEGGNTQAQCDLGARCSGTNPNYPVDYAAAVKWYTMAAEKNHLDALNNLGTLYIDGKGVPQDFAKAVELYTKAADAGNVISAQNLGFFYKNGNYTEKDPAKAFTWFRKGAEMGGAICQREVGLCYEYGSGVEKDLAAAVNWYTKAAEQGDADAQCDLGLCYELGTGIGKDAATALRWYEKAVAQGSGWGCSLAGTCYRLGIGTAQNNAKAFNLYNRAIEKGDNRGLSNVYNNLGVMYRDGDGAPQDHAKAFELFQKAYDLDDHKIAACNLGRLYRDGLGTDVDLAKAEQYLREAADSGSESAKEALQTLQADAARRAREQAAQEEQRRQAQQAEEARLAWEASRQDRQNCIQHIVNGICVLVVVYVLGAVLPKVPLVGPLLGTLCGGVSFLAVLYIILQGFQGYSRYDIRFNEPETLDMFKECFLSVGDRIMNLFDKGGKSGK